MREGFYKSSKNSFVYCKGSKPKKYSKQIPSNMRGFVWGLYINRKYENIFDGSVIIGSSYKDDGLSYEEFCEGWVKGNVW